MWYKLTEKFPKDKQEVIVETKGNDNKEIAVFEVVNTSIKFYIPSHDDHEIPQNVIRWSPMPPDNSMDTYKCKSNNYGKTDKETTSTKRVDYLVIYQLGSNEQSVDEKPITVDINDSDRAKAKYNKIGEELARRIGNHWLGGNIIIKGIYKL